MESALEKDFRRTIFRIRIKIFVCFMRADTSLRTLNKHVKIE